MLIIRQEQMDEFILASGRRFEEWMVVHLKRFFPEECHKIGDLNVRELIQYGIARARSYGFTTEQDICKYIDLMFALGRNFEVDVSLPWVRQILCDETPANAGQRLDLLCNAAIEKQQ